MALDTIPNLSVLYIGVPSAYVPQHQSPCPRRARNQCRLVSPCRRALYTRRHQHFLAFPSRLWHTFARRLGCRHCQKQLERDVDKKLQSGNLYNSLSTTKRPSVTVQSRISDKLSFRAFLMTSRPNASAVCLMISALKPELPI